MKFVVLAVLAVSMAHPTARADEAAPAPQKAILVTGASTGIGRKITEKLAADGYFVYAGARKDKDIADLSAIKNVQGLRLDVTKPDDIAAAVEIVTKGGRGLYGVVNNAGVALAGRLMETDEADIHFLMDVNLFGVFRVTRAFMPLIQKEKGRVVNIGSISGILARPVLGVYSMSKHSIESFTDTLADENTASGVSVSVIEPGNFKSDITASMLKHLTEETRDPKATPPTPEVLKRLGTGTRDEYPDPAPVAAVVERALFDAKPQRRYMIPGNQTEAEWTIKKQIQQLVQLNQNQPFSYSRDALIAMLDAAIAEEKAAH